VHVRAPEPELAIEVIDRGEREITDAGPSARADLKNRLKSDAA
jgi:hypothetical protein